MPPCVLLVSIQLQEVTESVAHRVVDHDPLEAEDAEVFGQVFSVTVCLVCHLDVVNYEVEGNHPGLQEHVDKEAEEFLTGNSDAN